MGSTVLDEYPQQIAHIPLALMLFQKLPAKLKDHLLPD